MSREKLHHTYRERITYFKEAVHRQNKRINLISLARLVVLVALIWMLVLGVRTTDLIFYLLSALILGVFLYLVGIFNKHKGERELFRQLLMLNQKEEACQDHDFHNTAIRWTQ